MLSETQIAQVRLMFGGRSKYESDLRVIAAMSVGTFAGVLTGEAFSDAQTMLAHLIIASYTSPSSDHYQRSTAKVSFLIDYQCLRYLFMV